MPETAKSFLLRPRLFIPVSKINKLLIALIIFTISSASGEFPFFNDTNITNKARVLAETTTHDNAPKNKPELSKGKTGQFQIRQIAIGQKASPLPTPTPTSIPPDTSNAAWGVAQKIGTHTYTMTIQPDGLMGTPLEMLAALNSYRQQQGKGALAWDDKLAGFANSRAEYFSQKNNLDSHAGFSDYLNNQDGFKKLGFANVGENSSIGFTLQAVHLIEWVYAGDAEHNNNQLNSDWQYVGIGVNGTSTDFVFGGNKL
jgi:uncharacterized protein YkwD